MHYMNGRPANIGDWIVGVTHREGKLECGIVLEIMPRQGPCNIRLNVFELRADTPEYDMGGQLVHLCKDKPYYLKGYYDYADCHKCILVRDGLSAVEAMIKADWRNDT